MRVSAKGRVHHVEAKVRRTNCEASPQWPHQGQEAPDSQCDHQDKERKTQCQLRGTNFAEEMTQGEQRPFSGEENKKAGKEDGFQELRHVSADGKE